MKKHFGFLTDCISKDKLLEAGQYIDKNWETIDLDFHQRYKSGNYLYHSDNISDSGKTLLYFAVEQNKEDFVKLFLQNGANPRIRYLRVETAYRPPGEKMHDYGEKHITRFEKTALKLAEETNPRFRVKMSLWSRCREIRCKKFKISIMNSTITIKNL